MKKGHDPLNICLLHKNKLGTKRRSHKKNNIQKHTGLSILKINAWNQPEKIELVK